MEFNHIQIQNTYEFIEFQFELLGATAFNQSIGDWDVSNVTNMSFMFQDAYAFNQPIGDWDVSNVTAMNLMFDGAASFNQDLSSWSVANVTSCGDFSDTSPLTEANTPNFTNCNP